MIQYISEIVLAVASEDPHQPKNGDDIRYRPSSTRVARYQIIIAALLGLFAFLTFSILRVKYPKIYVANFNHYVANNLHSSSRQNLPKIPAKSLFGWVPILFKITEDQILEHAGLDAVVFLGFFKMCIKCLTVCFIFAVTVISPIRFIYTGKVDQDYPDDGDDGDGGNDDDGEAYRVRTVKRFLKIVASGLLDEEESYQRFLWMYTVFTYVFTFVIVYFLFQQTSKIIKMRQSYLGKQNSLTDRTVKISGIPPVLRDEIDLKRHIEKLGIGEVDSIVIVREWNTLNSLFKLRKKVLRNLEVYWVEYFKKNGIRNKNDLLSSNLHPQLGDSINLNPSTSSYRDDEQEVGSTTQSEVSSDVHSTRPSLIEQISELVDHDFGEESTGHLPLLNDELSERPKTRIGWLGIFGKKVDAITYWSNRLEIIDKEIVRARTREYPATSSAFLTMKSVAQAQMLAQAVLDPKVNHLITNLAPAPHDIIWDNLCLTRQERNTRIALVTLFIGLVSVLMVYPVRYLATFLNIKTITKVLPKLGAFLKNNKWAETLVTGILPPYIFTIMNVVIPFFYVWISSKQGFTSHSDEELSTVSKNFFYIFVNLFLVFTLFGTASLSDTTKIAYELAQSLRDLSLFYVDLIILQGLGMFPFKLLLLGNLIRFPIESLMWCKTPRDYLKLYKPPVFNFGLQLPQPILILIITIVYSVMSTKILTAGLLYFIIGYFVCKYQLLYACIHPPHSTGKVWPLVFRRVIMGLLIFQLTMVGTLALQEAYICASFLAPLPFITFFFLWSFQKNYIPLSIFIALRSIENNHLPGHDEESFIDTSGSNSTEEPDHNKTLDERRELNTTFEFPNLLDNLDGPLIAIDRNEVLIINSEGVTVRKTPSFDEWD
ncbi:uncharacterized protein RJT20DRAFT_14503 [Scheffersomyces xylosifermentans]|uniref:uncharacterized protein n=1 Tax=Scheffersomyces xylosifermentans TaxID=1304137 RepID=UPI00315D38DE